MSEDTILKNIQAPWALDKRSIGELTEILEEYPYFQAAQLLLVKAMHNIKSIRFGEQLKTAAAYSTDRDLLFKLIRQREPAPAPAATPPAPAPSEAAAIPEPEAPPVLPPAKRHRPALAIQTQIIDYLQMYNQPEEAPQTDEQIANAKRSSKLIDNFLQHKQARVIPREEDLPAEQEDISAASVEESEFMTETLAKIFIKQKNFDKAIAIYDKLCLKYPQKSVYFADKIKEIQNLAQSQ